MKIIVRELQIDTEGEKDVTTQVQIVGLLREFGIPRAVQRPPALLTPVPGPAAIAAPVPEPETQAPNTDHKAPEAKEQARRTPIDRCQCGRPKLAKSKFCRHCAGIHAREARQRNRDGVNAAKAPIRAETAGSAPSV